MKFAPLFRQAILCACISALASFAAKASPSIVGYVTTDTPASSVRYGLITQANYAFLLPTSSGGYQALSNPSNLTTLVSSAHSQGVQVFIAVGGGNTPASTFDSICSSSSTITTFVNNLTSFVAQYNLDGVDIDWEFPSTGTSSTNCGIFMTQLANALHGAGKKLSMATVGAAWAGDGVPSSIFTSLDSMNVMAYDYSPTDVAPYSYAVSSLQYWANRGFTINHLVLGVPFYGYDGTWAGGITFASLVAMGANPNADTFTSGGTTYTYNGITTIQSKVSNLVFGAGTSGTVLNGQVLGGTMIWNLGQDATGGNSLLNAIDAVYVAQNSSVAAPAFSPAGGSYSTAQSVTISTTTSGATIRYTTDGSTPSSTTGTVYSGPVTIAANTTLQAVAYTSSASSTVAAATYGIAAQAPLFSPAPGVYNAAQKVTLSSSTSGASIRYTTDGSTPTTSTGMLYSAPFTLATNTTVNALAYKSGMNNSPVTNGAYSFNVAAPTFSPAAGAYIGTQNVTLASATSGASIRYTTDGSTPTATTGTLYSGAITVSASETIKAIAYAAGMNNSAVSSAAYTISPATAAAPTFSPAGGVYSGPQSVTLSTTTSGASIRYTTDGSTPTSTTGTVYSGPITVSSSLTVKAVAYATGMTTSAVSSASYTISTTTVVYQINAGGAAVSPFVADMDYSGGNAASVTTTITTAGVANAAPAAVYQSERWGASTYTLPSLTAGAAYAVRLHFAEIAFTSAGQRQFNVAINGTQVLTNFDIVAAAGAANKAVVETFTANADSTGKITVALTVGAADQPKISGIEVLATSGSPALFQVNSGGAAVSPFAADNYYSGGNAASVTTTITTAGVANAAPMAVYQSERWGASTYTFGGLAVGSSHTVRLHFAEIAFTSAGQREFNVVINGTQVLTNFDIVATAGAANKALVESFTANADSTGKITVAFTVGAADQPKISGVEIY